MDGGWTKISRLVANYETVSGAKDAKKSNRHHEQTDTVQRAFCEKVKQLTKVMEEMGNPFEEESGYLLTLDTKDIADPSAAQLIATHHERGKDKFNSFMANLQCENNCSFYQPIKKNRTTFFTNEPKSASKSETKLLKEDCNLPASSSPAKTDSVTCKSTSNTRISLFRPHSVTRGNYTHVRNRI